MITGYQRELTYRHRDGSFSAFGESDASGSLWLTAFVLKSFAQAKDLMYIDETVLTEAATWITSHQNNDGSFDSVGTICHREMLGGLEGKEALTAYVAIALLEAGENSTAMRSIEYLERQLDDFEMQCGDSAEFLPQQIQSISGITYRQLNTWVERGLFSPIEVDQRRSRTFSTYDAFVARVLGQFRMNGASVEVLTLKLRDLVL